MKFCARIILLFFVSIACTTIAQAKVTRYLTGNAGDVKSQLKGPAHVFGGGGGDVDAAIQWAIDAVRGCTNCAAKIDFVVLRASGSDGYNAPVFKMNGVDSVESIVVTERNDAVDQTVVNAIRNAEVVFFAGGDQCNYVKYFKGTEIERAVESVYAKGGAIGGTSAGLAIQTDFVYDACPGSSTKSIEALQNPYHSSISFTNDFFKWKNLRNTLADTHFKERDRMGRSLAFLARQIKDGRAKSALGIAVNEATSVVVDRHGIARVIGKSPNNAAYFILADHKPEVCEPDKPLTYLNFKIWKIKPDQTFNLRKRPKNGFYQISVNAGELSQNPY